jgi:hypothetical protein
MFSQKTNLYEDPNEHLMNNGHRSMTSSATFSQFSSSANTSSGYQNQDHPIRESSPSGYGSGSSYNSQTESKTLLKSSPSTQRAKTPKKTMTTTSTVSREEKTLLDLEAEFNPSKSKPKKKTLEDEFWAELEK